MSSDYRSMHISTAVCVKCGLTVFMLKVQGTTLATAMDQYRSPVPYFTATKYGYAVPGGGFLEHQCDVDVVKQFRSTFLGSPDAALELVFEAYEQVCPKCGAEPNTECWNLIERKRFNRDVHTKSPHLERYVEKEGR